MVGLKDAIEIITKWNTKVKKLGEDDILEIAAKLTSAGCNKRKHRGAARGRFDDRCQQVLAEFQSAEAKRLPVTRIKIISGHRSPGAVLDRLKNQAWRFTMNREIHGNRMVTYYTLLGKAESGAVPCQ